MELINPNIVDELLLSKIEQIVKRLKYSVSTFNIIEWLGNFNLKDVEAMLSLLGKLEYVTEHEIIEFLDNRLTTLFKSFKAGEKIHFLPIADFGKSGTLLTYYLKKTSMYRSNVANIDILQNANFLKNKIKTLPNGTIFNLVLLDDFFGSGRTLTTFFTSFVVAQKKLDDLNTRYFALSIYYLQKAQDRITRLKLPLQLIGERKNACFERGSSFSGSGRLKLRELAFNYGEDLMVDEKTGKTHPLGYNNSQSLVVFPYNPPNNTLPIIWSNRFSIKFSRRWVPLFPRTSVVKMDMAKRIRSKLAFELSLLQSTDLESEFFTGKHQLPWRSISFVQNTDFKIFGYLRLKAQRKSDVAIGQILGLSSNDIEEIQQNGIARDLFVRDSFGVSLSENGKVIYNNLLDSLKDFKKQIKFLEKKDLGIKEVIYLPTNFRGQTRKLN